MTDLNCLVSPAELLHLGSMLGDPSTDLSPLRGPSAGSVDMARLRAAGLVEGDALTDAGAQAMRTLARTKAYAALVLMGGSTFEHAVYLDGTARVSLTAEGDDLRLQSPAPDPAALLAIVFGEGDSPGVELDAQLTVPEACVLLGLIDLQRRRTLEAILDGVVVLTDAIPLADLRAWLTAPAPSMQWLAPMAREAGGAHLDLGSIDGAVASLAADHAVTVTADGIVPSELLLAVASRMLVLSAVARVRAARMDGDAAQIADIYVAQSQRGQHLLWEIDGAQQVQLRCLDAAALGTTLTPLLTNADALVLVPA